MIAYLTVICILGTCTICVSMFDAFSTPRFRPVRAGSFVALGLSGVIPATHFAIQVGFKPAIMDGSLGWLILMALLYIVGALIYAIRVPERCFPGYCDIWVGYATNLSHIWLRWECNWRKVIIELIFCVPCLAVPKSPDISRICCGCRICPLLWNLPTRGVSTGSRRLHAPTAAQFHSHWIVILLPTPL